MILPLNGDYNIALLLSDFIAKIVPVRKVSLTAKQKKIK